MRKSKIFIFFILFITSIKLNVFSNTINIYPNTEITIKTSSRKAKNDTKLLKHLDESWQWYFTTKKLSYYNKYVKILQTTVNLGKRYSLIITNPLDNISRDIILAGPKNGTYSLGVGYTRPYKLTKEAKNFTLIINFTPSSKSQTNILYIIFMSSQPNAEFKVNLRYPAYPEKYIKEGEQTGKSIGYLFGELILEKPKVK